MNAQSSPYVVFALIIGIAIVLGAIVFNNLTSRLATAPGMSQPDTPQPLPDIPASAMREDIPVSNSPEGYPEWAATIPEQTVGRVNLTSTVSGTYEPPTTLTRQFGVDLFTEVIEAGAAGASPEELENRISALSSEYAAKTAATRYTGADIQTLAQNDATAIRDYMNTLADIFIEHSPRNTRNRIDLFSAVIETGDQRAASELLAIAEQYRAMREQYLATPAPRDFVTAHVALINAVELLQHDLRNTAQFQTDPLTGQLSAQRYPNSSLALTRALQNLGAEAIRHQAAFDFAEDPALLFILTLPDVS